MKAQRNLFTNLQRGSLRFDVINFNTNIARVFKCVDENLLRVMYASGWTELPPFDTSKYIEMMMIPIKELEKPSDAISWFFEVSKSTTWACKKINPVTLGDVVTIKNKAFVYVPKDTEDSIDVHISTKLAVKEISFYV